MRTSVRGYNLHIIVVWCILAQHVQMQNPTAWYPQVQYVQAGAPPVMQPQYQNAVSNESKPTVEVPSNQQKPGFPNARG